MYGEFLIIFLFVIHKELEIEKRERFESTDTEQTNET